MHSTQVIYAYARECSCTVCCDVPALVLQLSRSRGHACMAACNMLPAWGSMDFMCAYCRFVMSPDSLIVPAQLRRCMIHDYHDNIQNAHATD